MVSKNELRKQWEEHIAEFRKSGQSAPTWCTAHGIKLHRFRYWLRKFPAKGFTEASGAIRWLAVEKDESPLEESGLTLQVGTVWIEIKPGFNPTLLKQVVRVLTHAG